MVNGGMQTLRKGTNEYTCMVTNAGPMCMGPIAMEWAQAWHNHTPPPYALGFIYMLNGDAGMSNTDPWATKQAPGNHWVKTGPHVMMVGLAVKKMTGFPRRPDPDPTKPYVMWSGTLYEHVMLPLNQNSRSGTVLRSQVPPRFRGESPVRIRTRKQHCAEAHREKAMTPMRKNGSKSCKR